MANLPLVDTMHHALQAWCIFCGVRPNTLGQLGQKGRNRLTPSEALATVPFSVKSTQNLHSILKRNNIQRINLRSL